MKNDEILSAAQKEKTGGEYENRVSMKSSLFGTLIGVLLLLALLLLEYFIRGTFDFGLVSVGMTMSGAQSLYEGAKAKKKYLIVIGIVQSLIAVFSVIAFIVGLVA